MIRRFAPLLLFVACSTGDSDPDVPRINAESPSTDPRSSSQHASADSIDQEPEATAAQWTVGTVDEPRQVDGAALLTSVRTASHEGFDRIVLEFEGVEIPSYHIEYVDRPVRQCGSGETVEIAGDGWLSLRIEPANAHTEAGEPTIEERVLEPELDVLREVRMICDFEAQVEWVLGVSTPNRYRVTELGDPTRLVVDVSH